MPATNRVTRETPRPAAPPCTITELATEFDITPRAIRFYEDVGLLAPMRVGRNRVYTLRDRTRLKLTLRGKRLGLSLLEIKQLVDLYDSPADTRQQLSGVKRLGDIVIAADSKPSNFIFDRIFGGEEENSH